MRRLPWILFLFSILLESGQSGQRGDSENHSMQNDPPEEELLEEKYPDLMIYGNETEPEERVLINKIYSKTSKANKLVRPVEMSYQTVNLTLDLYLIQILNLNEKCQVLTTNVWLTLYWNDPNLRWNPDDYSGLKRVSIDHKLVWTPDLVLYNYADERLKEQRDVMLIVKYDGNITWMPTAIFKSYCRIDITKFPFDEQFCFLKIGSWTYTARQMNISFANASSPFNLNDYTKSNEWELVAHPGHLYIASYFDDHYPYLIYFILLRRNASFTACILVLPCVLLASLTLVIFLLPPESPAKMALGMNIFVAFFLLLLLLADNTPSASTNVPNLGIYFCMNMFLITLSSFLTVSVTNSYFRGDKTNRVPIRILNILIRIGALAPVPEHLKNDLDTNPASAKRHSASAGGEKFYKSDNEFNDGTKKDPYFEQPKHFYTNNLVQGNAQQQQQKSVVILENFKMNERPKSIKGNRPSTRKKSLRIDTATLDGEKMVNDNTPLKQLSTPGNEHAVYPGYSAVYNNPECSCCQAYCYPYNQLMSPQMMFHCNLCNSSTRDPAETKGPNSYLPNASFNPHYAPMHQAMHHGEGTAMGPCGMCKIPACHGDLPPPLLHNHPHLAPPMFGANSPFISNINSNPATSAMPNGAMMKEMNWEGNLREIRNSLRDFQTKIHIKEIASRKLVEWRCVATVLDRIFLAMYFLIQMFAIYFIIPTRDKDINWRVAKFKEEFFSDS